MGALFALAYVAGVDSCLVSHSTPSPFRSYSTVALGLLLQVASLGALMGLIVWTGKYSELVNRYLKEIRLKALAWIGPLLLLLISIDMMTLGLYNNGFGNKIENSKLRNQVFRECYLAGIRSD